MVSNLGMVFLSREESSERTYSSVLSGVHSEPEDKGKMQAPLSALKRCQVSSDLALGNFHWELFVF